jgi:hypothetical protein
VIGEGGHIQFAHQVGLGQAVGDSPLGLLTVWP